MNQTMSKLWPLSKPEYLLVTEKTNRKVNYRRLGFTVSTNHNSQVIIVVAKLVATWQDCSMPLFVSYTK
jgi:hypothetical protein